jgi:hypothetical protein
LQAGRETALQYRELLQLVLHVLSRPNPAANLEIKNNFPVVSRKIAQCVTGLVSMAEILKGEPYPFEKDITGFSYFQKKKVFILLCEFRFVSLFLV